MEWYFAFPQNQIFVEIRIYDQNLEEKQQHYIQQQLYQFSQLQVVTLQPLQPWKNYLLRLKYWWQV